MYCILLCTNKLGYYVNSGYCRQTFRFGDCFGVDRKGIIMAKNKSIYLSTILYWLPRTLSILFIIFISMFALDVFGEENWLKALIIHLIPSYILIIMTAIAWKHEQVGGAIYLILGLFLLVSSHFESLVITIPVVILGLLFLSRRFLSKLIIV